MSAARYDHPARPPSHTTRSRLTHRPFFIERGGSTLEARGDPAAVFTRHVFPPWCYAVASSGDACAYECAYRLVSADRFSPQFVATTNWPICSIFRLGANDFTLFGRTFNPKVAGSNPARPIATSGAEVSTECPTIVRRPAWATRSARSDWAGGTHGGSRCTRSAGSQRRL
jgi:hypothetical protein